MKTEILETDENSLKKAAEIIRQGGLVAFKTETVYGLGADAFNQTAVRSIFEVKGRPADNPLIVHLSDPSEIKTVADNIPNSAKKLIDRFMPGALTLIFDRASRVPKIVSAGLDTVAIRIPSENSAREFIKVCKTPIAAPSANTSTRPSPTSAKYVFDDLNGKIPLILDGGECAIGLESTVLDIRNGNPVILRQGGISQDEIENVLGQKVKNNFSSDRPIAPGMKYRHYAPNAIMYYVSYGNEEKIKQLYNSIEAKTKVILATDESLMHYKGMNISSLGKDGSEAAHNLFRLLRELEKDYEVIIAEGCKEQGLGRSVNSRLIKAAGENILV